MLSNKIWGKGGGRGGDVQSDGICPPEIPLQVLSPAFLDVAENLPADGKQ